MCLAEPHGAKISRQLPHFDFNALPAKPDDNGGAAESAGYDVPTHAVSGFIGAARHTLIQEYIRRANLSKVHVTLVAFETLKCPEGCDAFISTRRKSPADIVKEASRAYQPASTGPPKRRLILIDAINPLLTSRRVDSSFSLPAFFGALSTPSTSAKLETSLVVAYHHDVPGSAPSNLYAPSQFSMLTYLATTMITLHSFSHILAQKAARDRSLAAPVFGLEEEQEGVLLGRLDKLSGTGAAEGIVLELEHRRRSGRGVLEWYLLPPASRYSARQVKEVVTLLDDNVLYNPPVEADDADEEPTSTFDLGLTERQRRDREGVVLPYFDAQNGDGPGEGGRILYDMGEEDDFDEEEDEI